MIKHPFFSGSIIRCILLGARVTQILSYQINVKAIIEDIV